MPRIEWLRPVYIPLSRNRTDGKVRHVSSLKKKKMEVFTEVFLVRWLTTCVIRPKNLRLCFDVVLKAAVGLTCDGSPTAFNRSHMWKKLPSFCDCSLRSTWISLTRHWLRLRAKSLTNKTDKGPSENTLLLLVKRFYNFCYWTQEWAFSVPLASLHKACDNVL